MAIRLTETRLRQIIKEEARRLTEFGGPGQRNADPFKGDYMRPMTKTVKIRDGVVKYEGEGRFSLNGMMDREFYDMFGRMGKALNCTITPDIRVAKEFQSWYKPAEAIGTLKIAGPDEFEIQNCIDELTANDII